MMKKCLKKFEPYKFERGIDVDELKSIVSNVQIYFNKIDNTNIIDDSYVITLKGIHE